MSPLQIIQYPHPTLRHVSQPLKKVDRQVRDWAAEMIELMYEHEGIGLAANQVDLPYRMFVINVEGDPDKPELERVFINPVISRGKGLSEMSEGCLSLPDVRGPVTRNTTIRVQAYDLAGNEIDEVVDGMLARVILHETDHLDGILFTDKVPATTRSELDHLLHEFELAFNSRLESGELPHLDAMAARLAELQEARC
ncbi:peptide deformylase [Botrimarina hoheduenensis]|uniref:Peptide deformylase n=1 Tax=Botrimarina hoheduenensis TaxID=2528000 RepID=A0A5C5W888_9BACT|nr:peptide deformylase [Botrimarina hoheduenensis]TWT46473.1 Peptide deformylase [Botrimarina hoheduenensis]